MFSGCLQGSVGYGECPHKESTKPSKKQKAFQWARPAHSLAGIVPQGVPRGLLQGRQDVFNHSTHANGPGQPTAISVGWGLGGGERLGSEAKAPLDFSRFPMVDFWGHQVLDQTDNGRNESMIAFVSDNFFKFAWGDFWKGQATAKPQLRHG